MPDVCSFRQVDEKHVSAEVDLMEWSPKMDLIAVANIQGEVGFGLECNTRCSGSDAKACPIAQGKFDSKKHSFGQVHGLI